MNRRMLFAAFVLMAFLIGCARVPPQNVVRDRLEYSQVLSDSWKRQTLINVVRLRYSDAPVFLDVSSVINGYSESVNVNANASIPEGPGARMDSGFGGSRSWSNSPTITYQPLSGEKFTKSLLKPIPPSSLFQMMQAGWPVELVFPLAVRTMNHLRNQSSMKPADREFESLLESLGKVQRSDAIGFRVEAKEGGEAVVIVIRQGDNESIRADAENVRVLLDLEPGLTEFNITFGTVPRDRHEVAMVTRSMLEIMLELAGGVDVPAPHLSENRVLTGFDATESDRANLKPLVHIYSGKSAPPDAYAAVPYNGYWFWIDDRDVPSKKVFTFMMILFSLCESGQASAAPVVTISAGH